MIPKKYCESSTFVICRIEGKLNFQFICHDLCWC